jgi:hypothetical protein
MVHHDRKRNAVDREDGSQMFQPLPRPLPPVLKVFSGQRVLAAEIRTSNAAIPNVHDLNLTGVNRSFPSSASHATFLLHATARSSSPPASE